MSAATRFLDFSDCVELDVHGTDISFFFAVTSASHLPEQGNVSAGDNGRFASTSAFTNPMMLVASNSREEVSHNSLKHLSDVDQIAEQMLRCSCGFSIIYFRPDLNAVFVGRDIFGRQSLVFCRPSSGRLRIACAVQHCDEESMSWCEIPYGSITVISLAGDPIRFHSVIDEYPDELDKPWIQSLEGAVERIVHHDIAQPLFKVNPLAAPQSIGDIRPTRAQYVPILLRHLCSALNPYVSQDETTVAVAFSGGIDSLLMVYVLDMVARDDVRIDLINVAFGDEEVQTAPDRKRALDGYAELCRLRPTRRFRLILTNVSSSELEECRQNFIAKAALPCTSVLDDSLACVVWFALRGQGICHEGDDLVRSPASTFLLGSGADELCAGYSRHRHRFEKEGAPGLADELQLELRRYGARNGGRDARVALQHRKTAVAPFLEPSVVAFCNRLPLSVKCDLTLPRGIGEKAIVRECLQQLGSQLYKSPKQAMQFGSRLAKLDNRNKNIKGSDRSTNLTLTRQSQMT